MATPVPLGSIISQSTVTGSVSGDDNLTGTSTTTCPSFAFLDAGEAGRDRRLQLERPCVGRRALRTCHPPLTHRRITTHRRGDPVDRVLQSLLDFNAASPEVTATVAYPDLVADAELTHDEVLARRTVAAFCEHFGDEPERTRLTGAHPEGTAKNP